MHGVTIRIVNVTSSLFPNKMSSCVDDKNFYASNNRVQYLVL